MTRRGIGAVFSRIMRMSGIEAISQRLAVAASAASALVSSPVGTDVAYISLDGQIYGQPS